MGEYEDRIREITAELESHSTHPSQQHQLLLGYSEDKPVFLRGKDLHNSIHIMGASQEGKSKQLQNIFQQLIMQGMGGALIDPHGYLYDDLLAFCSHQSSRDSRIRDRVVLFDPCDDEFIAGFNALAPLAHDIEMLTLSRMYATIKARGLDSFDSMPTAKTWLYNIFYPLIQKGLTLIEARYLIDRGASKNEIAQAIVEGTGIDLIEHDWSWFASQPKRTQYEELLSSINMLRNFVTSKRIELIFGRRKNVLDLRDIMDSGKVLLVNLRRARLHKDTARLLGTLLVNEFLLAAMTRPEGSRPFYLAIDEFENYVTQDIADVLDQAGKFGLHLILAHHSLDQLKTQNRQVYASVMQNAKVKIIFGGLTYEDSEVMVKELYSYVGKGGLDPYKEKRVQKSPYIEPHESTRTVKADTLSDNQASSSLRQTGRSDQSGEVSIPVDSMFMSDRLLNYIRTQGMQSSESSGLTEITGLSLTETLVPFIEQELKWYISSIQYAELGEQIYQAVARMKNLPQQVCLLKLPKSPVQTMKSVFIKKPHLLEGELREFSRELNARSPYHLVPADAKTERLKALEVIMPKADATTLEGEDSHWENYDT